MSNTEFKFSIEGLKDIISERKLYKKRVYVITTILITLLNIILLIIYFCNPKQLDYFCLLKNLTTTLLPVLTTFCGFSMTAYSLVVGFLNYGSFKTTIEKWYKNKLIANKKGETFENYTLFQKAIALFALTIILLIITVALLSLTQFIIKLNITTDGQFFHFYNAFIFFILSTITVWCFLLTFYNIINIFTFSQTLHLSIYTEEYNKSNTNQN